MNKLDEWDMQLIACIKRAGYKMIKSELREIWADRCSLSLVYVKDVDIENRLMLIITDFNLIGLKEFYSRAREIFRNSSYGINEDCHFENVIWDTIISIIMMSEVSKLPDLKEYIESIKGKES